MDDLQFTPEGDMRDLAGTTLLLSVRDNDLKGSSSDDLTSLAEIHGNPSNQREHCLRGPDRQEPGGSEAAVADCRAFIRGRVMEALDGLDAAGTPDFAKRSSLSLHLALRGHVNAPLPTYYVRIGQALHAVQDSFTHTYRTADGMKITVVLDWLGSVNGSLRESRDGPAHAAELDVCGDADELRTTRRELAIDASTAILRATLDPGKTHGEKLAALDEILDTYVSYAPGCTFENGWCEAPERQYKDSKGVLGCGTTGGVGGQRGGAIASWGLVALLALACRTPRWKRRGRRAGALLVAGAIGLAPGTAHGRSQHPPGAAASVAPAATSTTTETPAKAATRTKPATPATTTTTTTVVTPAIPDTHSPPPPQITPVLEPGPSDPSQTAWGAYLGTAASFDKAAAAVQLGARLKVSRRWTLGVDGEWNPWISLTGPRMRRGVLNTYGTVILRLPLAYESFNLRTTFNVGTSYLLMSLYGAPSGSLGLYVGLSPLGLEWKLSRRYVLIVNPLNVALPAPQLQGVPLIYPQYRFSIGLGIMNG
jgi:hypothetical protein